MVSVDILLKVPSLRDLRLVAGHLGLSREISSVSIMDAPDSYKWLRGGEFILSSGFLLGGDDWQFEHLINTLIEADCSAFGIKKGRFLNTIPEIVMKMAEQNQFPIVEIPYSYRWSEIISAFYSLSQNISENSLDPTNPMSVAFVECKKEIDCDNDILYRDFLSKLQSGEITLNEIHSFDKFLDKKEMVYFGILNIKSTDRMKMYHDIENILHDPRLMRKFGVHKQIIDSETEEEAIILLELYSKGNESVEQWQYLFFEELEYYMHETNNGSISMGKLYPNTEGILKSYREAKEAFAIGRALWDDKRCFFYTMLSVYNALQNIDTSNIDLGYIQMLENYQVRLSFDGIESLEAYIECGGFKKAASKLFIHENTLRYRIQKIGDLLHLNLDDSVICNALIIQVKLWRLMNEKRI